MAVKLSPLGGAAGQFFDNSGNPLSGGKLYTYGAGTTTPLVGYTTTAGTVPHSNPIVLDAAGRVPGGEIWLSDGLAYKFVLRSSADVLIGTYDNVTGISANVLSYVNAQEIQTATAGQTVFTLATTQYQPGTNTLSVFVNGLNQYGPGATYQYLETNSTTVTFLTPLAGGEKVKFTTAQIVSSSGTSANEIGYTPGGTGAVATTVQTKLRQMVSVKDFGALGDGVANDTAAFIAAAAASSYVVVPKGTYLLNSDVTALNTVFEFQDALKTGDGKLKSNHVISYSSGGVYTSRQTGFVEFNRQIKGSADLASSNLGNYPNRYYPTSAYIELLRLSPGVTVFENQTGTVTNAMNETYFRETIREMAGAGIKTVIIAYVEYQGFWFYKPSFAYPYDYDTSRTGKYWSDWLTGYPNVLTFNPVAVTLDECARLGMGVYLGLSRNGDTALMGDLYKVLVTGAPDPMRYGLTLNQRLTNAVNQTREIAADLVSQFGHMPSFTGFYISHEPDHLGSSNNYLTPVNSTSGVYPDLRSYQKPILVAPSSPLDLNTDSAATFANKMIVSGCSIFAPQDSVGPGYDFAVYANYTYVPSVAIAKLASHFAAWQAATVIANAKQNLTSRAIRLWCTTEFWQMGFVQNTTLTLSALSGASVTATAGANSFAYTDVGKWISTADTGNAIITSYTSPTIVTVDTTIVSAAGNGRPFLSTSQVSGNWSLNTQYSNDYPAVFSRVQSQLLDEWPFVEAVAIYAWFGFLDSGTLSLRPSQANSGLTDYRTRAVTLYNDYTAWQAGQRRKYSAASNLTVIQQQYYERAAAAAAIGIVDDFTTFYPRSEGSRVSYICTIRGYLETGTSTLTLTFRVNSVAVKTVSVPVIANNAGGTYTFLYSELPRGLARLIGFSFASTSANFVLQGVEVMATEAT